MKKLITTTAVILSLAAATAGCGTSSGKRSGKPVYGPGSTGHLGSSGNGSNGGGGGGGGSGTGAFSSAPAMGNPRSQHTATTLPDGRVLVTGGTDGNNIYQTSEIFDPLANTWTPVQSGMTINGFDSARQLHTATLMSTGKVLIAGGLGQDTAQGQFGALASCVVFDPASDTFTATGALPQARGWHLATGLSNGQVLVAGGMDAGLNTDTTSAVYDPASGAWIAGGASAAHTWGALVTTGGQSLIVGGVEVAYNATNAQNGQFPWDLNNVPTPTVERFDPAARTFGQGPNNNGDRIYYSGAASSGGKALFAGGYAVDPQGNLVKSDTTEIYDPSQNAFTNGPVMSVARDSAEITEIGNSGDMLVIGGVDAANAVTPVCEVVLMSSGTIAGQASMAQGRVDHRVVTLNDGRILVVGGVDDNGNSLDMCEFYTR